MYAISPWEACRGPAPDIDADTVFELHLVLEDMRSRAVGSQAKVSHLQNREKWRERAYRGREAAKRKPNGRIERTAKMIKESGKFWSLHHHSVPLTVAQGERIRTAVEKSPTSDADNLMFDVKKSAPTSNIIYQPEAIWCTIQHEMSATRGYSLTSIQGAKEHVRGNRSGCPIREQR